MVSFTSCPLVGTDNKQAKKATAFILLCPTNIIICMGFSMEVRWFCERLSFFNEESLVL